MSRWQSLAEQFASAPDLAGLTDDQVRSVVEVLALTIHADETVAPIEVAGFNHLVAGLPMMEGRETLVHEHVKEANKRARAAVTDDSVRRELARDAASRLQGSGLREQVFRMAASLASVDFEVVPAEEQALGWLAEAFEIASDRARDIIDEASPP